MSITRAVITNPDEASAAVAGAKRLHQVWQVQTDSAFDTAFDVMYATLDGVPWLPQVGSPLYRWQYRPDDERYVPELKDPADPAKGYRVADPDVRASLVEPRRLADDPTTWEVAVTYESADSPTADIPQIAFGKVRFQRYVTTDVRGLVLTNSALDPYEGGVVTDRSRRMLTIERNVAYEVYDPLLTQEFEETLNAKPYKLGLLRRIVYTTDAAYPIAAADPEKAPVLGPTGAHIGYSIPLRVPPGMARLTELTGWRRTLARGPSVSQTAFYWQIQVQIEIDRSVFTDEHGQEQPTRWRKVLADVGPHILNDKGQQIAAYVKGGTASNAALLNGAGGRLALTGTGVAQTAPPAEAARTVADAGAGMEPVDRARVPWPRHLWFGAIEDTDMTVTAEKGLYIADGRRVATGVTVSTDPEHGAVELDGTAGGFTYTPDDGYVGWDRFGFRLSGPAGTSDEAFAIIKIGPRPRVRVFDVDYEKDWDPIAPLIGGW